MGENTIGNAAATNCAAGSIPEYNWDVDITGCSARKPDEIPGTWYVEIGPLTIPVSNGYVQNIIWRNYDKNCDHRFNKADITDPNIQAFSDKIIAYIYSGIQAVAGISDIIQPQDYLLLADAMSAANNAFEMVEWLGGLRGHSDSKQERPAVSMFQDSYRKFNQFLSSTNIVQITQYYIRYNGKDLIRGIDHWIDLSNTQAELKPLIVNLAVKMAEVFRFANNGGYEYTTRPITNAIFLMFGDNEAIRLPAWSLSSCGNYIRFISGDIFKIECAE